MAHRYVEKLRGVEKDIAYIVLIARRNAADPQELFWALVKAWKEGEARCGGVVVSCRESTVDHCYFQLSSGSEIKAQFRFPMELLVDHNWVLLKIREFAQKITLERLAAAPDGTLKVAELKIGMRGVSVEGQITQLSETAGIRSAYGRPLKLVVALLRDETGSIRLNLWDEQIGLVSIGDKVRIENGAVNAFMGERRLQVPRRRGKIKVQKAIVAE